MEGWIGLYRKLACDPLWLSEKFTRGQAWVDLLMLANHSPGFIRVQGMRVELQRGDVGYSENTLADRWKWSRTRVRNFLQELIEDEMILKKIEKKDEKNGGKKDKRKSVISIVNYNQYQDFKKQKNTSDDTSDEQATNKRRYKNNNVKNDNNGNKEKIIGDSLESPDPTPEPEEVVVSKKKGYQKKEGYDFSVFPSEIERETIEAFIEHRGKMKKPVTQRALKTTIKYAMEISQKYNIEPNEVIDCTIAKGWQTCDPTYDYWRNRGNGNSYTGGKKTESLEFQQNIARLLNGKDNG